MFLTSEATLQKEYWAYCMEHDSENIRERELANLHKIRLHARQAAEAAQQQAEEGQEQEPEAGPEEP